MGREGQRGWKGCGERGEANTPSAEQPRKKDHNMVPAVDRRSVCK